MSDCRYIRAYVVHHVQLVHTAHLPGVRLIPVPVLSVLQHRIKVHSADNYLHHCVICKRYSLDCIYSVVMAMSYLHLLNKCICRFYLPFGTALVFQRLGNDAKCEEQLNETVRKSFSKRNIN